MNKVNDVREQLETAEKTRGRIAAIAREVGIDQRTVRALLNNKHAPNAATLDKLDAYFKKLKRREQP